MKALAAQMRRGVVGGLCCMATTHLQQRRTFFLPSPSLLLSSSYRKRRLGSDEAVDPLAKPTVIDKAALHVVSVPIGNMKDFSFRAIDVLERVDYIVTSDRPATKALLDLVNIPSQGRLIHFSRSNQTATCAKLVELLRGGRSMALVTTSGTPCIGDVGASLVQEMHASGVRVVSVPGPAAFLSALTVCGVTGSPFDPETTAAREDRLSQSQGSSSSSVGEGNGLLSKRELNAMRDGSFFFGNMLPSAHGERLRLLRNVVAPAHFPCIFYEIPRRLLSVLQDIAAVLPKRRVFVCHELTKMNESLHADTAEKLVTFYLRQEAQMMVKRGELVLVIAGAGPEETAAWMEREALKRRRMRRTVKELMAAGGGGGGGATGARSSHEPPGPDSPSSLAPATTTTGARRKALSSRQALRKARLRKKRERLIEEIEREQERLRLSMAASREGGKPF